MLETDVRSSLKKKRIDTEEKLNTLARSLILEMDITSESSSMNLTG